MNKYQTLDQENLGKKIMREQFDRALFQATFENLLSQVFQKQINANKIQMDLIRKIQGKSESVGSHLQIIKQCRKSIDYVDMILKDVRQYFFDLKIDELYNLFDSLFRILVYILKKVSQCYLRRVQMQRKNQIDFLQKDYQKSINQAQNRQKQNSQKKRINNRKKDMRQLQILDFQIAGIELKEQQINNKMNLLISDLQQERRKIQNIDPVSHNQIYNEIEKIFIEISQKTECLFNNFFKGAFQQQNNFVRPQQIQDQVLCPLKNDLKFLAKSKINKVIQIMSITFQNKLDKSIQQMKTFYFKRKPNKKRTQNISIRNNQLKYYVSSPNSQKSFKKCLNQTDSSVQKQNFKKHHAKFMQMHGKQSEQLKKTIRCLNSQIQELKKIIKKQQSDRIKLSQESLQLQKLFKRRTFELQQAKSSLKQAIQRNIVESSMCTYKKQVFSQHPNKKLNILNEKNTKFDMQHKQTQTDENSQSLGKQPVVVQYKSFISVRSKIRKGSIDAQEKNKNKRRVPQAQKNLKSVISKLSGLLIEKQIKQNTKQTLQIQKLVQQDKYEEVIEIIKKNLNVASQSKKNSGSDTVIQEKQKNTRQKKKRDQKIVKNQNSKINSCQMVNYGVQTMQRSMKSNIKVFKNTLRDNQPNRFFNKTHSMDSHELQNKIPQQKLKKDEHYLSSTQTPLNWLRSARQTKQNEDSNFLIKNIRQPFYRNSMVDQKFHETKMKTNGKKNIFLENTLFEQINLDVAESNKARSKRDSLMLKMYGMKQKQNMQKDYRNRNSKNSGIIIQQYEDGTNSNKISNSQQDLKYFTDGRDYKQSNIKREDFILDKCGVKQGSQENNQDFSSQKLIEMLKSASNQINPDKINQIIDKFKQSYITKCSNFSDKKNKIND